MRVLHITDCDITTPAPYPCPISQRLRHSTAGSTGAEQLPTRPRARDNCVMAAGKARAARVGAPDERTHPT